MKLNKTESVLSLQALRRNRASGGTGVTTSDSDNHSDSDSAAEAPKPPTIAERRAKLRQKSVLIEPSDSKGSSRRFRRMAAESSQSDSGAK